MMPIYCNVYQIIISHILCVSVTQKVFFPCLHGVRAYRLGIDNTIMSELASYFTSSRR